MLREEQANIRTLKKKRDTENYLCKVKLQEKEELLDKEKEQTKYLEDQHHQEVYKLKNEISCLKIELENYTAKLPPTESYLGTHKPKKKQSQAHKRSILHVENRFSNEKKRKRTTAVMLHQNPGCFKCGSISPHTASQCPSGVSFVANKDIIRIHVCSDVGFVLMIKLITHIQIFQQDVLWGSRIVTIAVS